MIHYEQQYYEALTRTLKDNIRVIGRDFVPVIKMRDPVHFEINLLREGLPLLRGKKMFPVKPLVELTWMMQGRNDLAFLQKYGVTYWDKFDVGDGTIGNSYGPRLRNLNGVDQIQYVADLLKNEPYSRRILLSFWNPVNDEDSVVPCYTTVQFKVIDGYINLIVTQRSGDAFIGVPNDVLLFAYMASLFSYYTGLIVGTVYYTVNDFHIYEEHLPAVRQYMTQYEGWYTLYEKIKPFISVKIHDYIGHPPTSVDEILQAFVDTNFEHVYNFNKYKSNPYIKAEVIK